MLKDKVMEIAEELGWNTTYDEDEYIIGEHFQSITFSQGSPAGEDFSFDVLFSEDENIVDEIEGRVAAFDTDEHVGMWLDARNSGVSGVPDAETLVKDAKAIKEMLDELVEQLKEKI